MMPDYPMQKAQADEQIKEAKEKLREGPNIKIGKAYARRDQLSNQIDIFTSSVEKKFRLI